MWRSLRSPAVQVRDVVDVVDVLDVLG